MDSPPPNPTLSHNPTSRWFSCSSPKTRFRGRDREERANDFLTNICSNSSLNNLFVNHPSPLRTKQFRSSPPPQKREERRIKVRGRSKRAKENRSIPDDFVSTTFPNPLSIEVEKRGVGGGGEERQRRKNQTIDLSQNERE
ncbi:hypothetical protein CDAR_581571 [Caerostris darwini]|uniref:Uncharacterized protein n=1 Tax=Caerostris darwini TaxID=1538125 RepID=A0AAV4X6H6_9ARAC|nr:hypothetical protein CDAR_581571 [Caerostris darwini]